MVISGEKISRGTHKTKRTFHFRWLIIISILSFSLNACALRAKDIALDYDETFYPEPVPSAISNKPTNNSTHNLSEGITSTLMSEVSPEYIMGSLASNIYLVAVNHPIELEYVTEIERSNGTTAELEQIYSKYQKLWEAEIEKYQSLISEELVATSESSILFQINIESWQTMVENDINTYVKIQEELHGESTIIASNESRLLMEQYRLRAIQLISLYDEVMVGRGWSWENQHMTQGDD